MGEKKTILIVEDHPVFREGLKSLLAEQSSYEVVGEAASGEEGLRKAKELRPDLVIMDISLPDVSGIEVTRSIRQLLSETRVVILSMHLKVDYVVKAFRAGATGYVTKEWPLSARLFSPDKDHSIGIQIRVVIYTTIVSLNQGILFNNFTLKGYHKLT